MPVLAAAAATVFAAATTFATAVGTATLASVGLAGVAGMGIASFTGALTVGTLVGALTIGSTALSLFSAAKKPKAGAGSPSPISWKADPNAYIPVVAGGPVGVGGNQVFAQTAGSKNRWLQYVTVLSHCGPCVSVTPFKANDEVVTFNRDNGQGASGRYQDRFWMKNALGIIGAAATIISATGTKYVPTTNGGLPPEWNAASQLSGMAHSVTSMWSDPERIPQIPKHLWEVIGGPVYDPRKDGTQPGGVGPQRWNDRTTWSTVGNTNPYLQAMTFTIGHKFNGVRIAGVGVPLSMIDVPAFVNGANVADANGWKIAWQWHTGMRKWDVFATMLQAGAGLPLVRGSQISCMVDTPRVSIGTITDADLRGDFSVTGCATIRDRKNAIIPRCKSAAHNWTVQPHGRIAPATYLAEDNGEERPVEVEYEAVADPTQVRQLAALELANLREGLAAVIPVAASFRKYRAGDCLTVNAGATLLTGQKVVVVKREFNHRTRIVNLTVRSETDGKHAYAMGRTAEPPPSPSLTGADPTVIEPPTPDAWVPSPGQVPGGGTGGGPGSPEVPVIVIVPADPGEGAGSDDPAATQVVVRYRRTGLDPSTGAPYEWAQEVFPARSDRLELKGLAPGVSYEVELAYRVRGITSAFTPYGVVTTGRLVSTTSGGLGDRLAADILAELDAVPGNIAAAVAAVDANVAALDAAVALSVSNINAAIAAIEYDIDDPTTGIKARIGAVETVAEDAASRVDVVEVSLNTPTTGLLARTGSLETVTQNLQENKASATRVDLLETQVQTPTTGLLSRATSVEGRVTNVESGKASAARVDALEATVDTPLTGLTARTGSLETVTANLQTGKADATRVTTLEASAKLLAAGDYANVNPTFPGYVATGSSIPVGWSDWNTATGHTAVAGQASDKAIRWVVPALADRGMLSFSTNPAHYKSPPGPGWWVIDALVTLESGSLNGSGMLLQTGGGGDFSINFAGDADNTGSVRGAGVAGQTYRFSKLVNITPGLTSFVLYQMAGWSGFQAVAAKTIVYHLAGVRRATAGEVEAGQARGAFTSLAARYVALETATADLNTGKASAGRVTTLEASAKLLAAGDYINANPTFPGYVATGSSIPAGWADWSGIATQHTAVAGQVSDKAIRWVVPAAINQGFSSNGSTPGDFKGDAGPGWWVMDGVVTLESGSLLGSGMLVQTATGTGVPVGEDTVFNFGTEADSTGVVVGAGVAGRTYKFSKLFKVANTTTRRFVLYQFGAWDGLGAPTPAKTIVFHLAGVRRATAGEIEAGQARGAFSSLAARYVAVENTAIDLQTNKASASRVTQLETLGRTIPNKVMNSDGSQGMRTWTGAQWATGSDANIGTFFYCVTAGTHFMQSDFIPVAANSQYILSFEGDPSSNPGANQVYCSGYTLAQVYYEDGLGITDCTAIGWFLRKSTVITTGPNTSFIRIACKKDAAAPHLFLSRFMLTTGNTPVAWSDTRTVQDTFARVTSTETAINGADGLLASWSRETAIPGASAFITARARSAPGAAPTSDVAIGARVFSVYNQIGENWIKALEVIGGNAVFSGGLQAGAFIRLGNGTGWPVALRPVDFSLSDGEVCSFGTDLGGLPSLSFALNNLAALTAGETYEVKATGLTATGFTLSAKISVPATPSSQTTAGPGYSEPLFGHASGRTLYLEGKPVSSDGTYRVQASGVQFHRIFRNGPQPEIYGEPDVSTTTLEVYGFNGAWQLAGYVYVDTYAESDVSGSYSVPWTMDEVMQFPANTQYVNVSRVGSSNGQSGSVQGLGPVSWQSQGSGAGVRSATPSGQKTRVTVRPQ